MNDLITALRVTRVFCTQKFKKDFAQSKSNLLALMCKVSLLVIMKPLKELFTTFEFSTRELHQLFLSMEPSIVVQKLRR
jgi:hypothetical protein